MKGKHLIAGKWVGSEEHFPNVPVNGQAETFASGSPALVDEAVRAAEAAFESYAATSRINRAAFIYSIAEEIEARAEQITEMGTRETGLPAIIAEDPLSCVARGGGRALELLDEIGTDVFTFE